MNILLDWLNSTVFTVLGETISVVELIGFVTGALCVWAVTRQYLWNWPVGILNNIAFIVLFLGAGLYADTALQVVFGLVGVYGWVVWARGRRRGSGRPRGRGAEGTIRRELPVRHATRLEILVGVLATAAATVVVALLLANETNSVVPWPDAFILAASLLATWGQAKKIFEQWWVWIVVDLVSVPLYAVKGLSLTALLYTGFLALCISGVVTWRRQLARQADEPDVRTQSLVDA
ncbi:membrane protein [Frondihabitans sucicola]|uniref:Membrane protein n=1 Tax=Frondihabitans sucicola TaxID=1268041 RepID=A0ABN6Y5P3_9MICO|nr:nicotinamide riboside transporter PnuC [Frondihabitans sucicola]BDZ51225.1 membrane protein [Frondihabitans sucicola]